MRGRGTTPSPELVALAATPEFPLRQRLWILQIIAELAALGGDDDRVRGIVARLAELPFVDLLWMDRCPLLARFKPDPAFARSRTTVAARADAIWS